MKIKKLDSANTLMSIVLMPICSKTVIIAIDAVLS